MKTYLFSLLIVTLTATAFVSDSKTSDAVLDNTTIDTFNLQAYKGKFIVLNFWASWSKASRLENKSLVHVYQNYQINPKVVFVSVSLDTDKISWQSAIADDGLTWPNQYCDFKKYASAPALQFKVSTLPQIMILNTNGEVVYTAQNAHDLEAQLQALLKS